MKITDIEKICPCCGNLFIGHKLKKYCKECRDISKNVMMKIYKNKYYKKTKGSDYMKEKFNDVDISIEMSDKNFVSQICNEDCINCQYDDCILPVDED